MSSCLGHSPWQCPFSIYNQATIRHSGKLRASNLPKGGKRNPVPHPTPNCKGKIRTETKRTIFVLNFHWLKKYVNAKMLTRLSHYGLLCNYFFDSSWRLNWRHNGLLCNDIFAEFFACFLLFLNFLSFIFSPLKRERENFSFADHWLFNVRLFTQ